MVGPMAASFIGSAGHADEGLMEPLDGTDTFMVLGGSWTEVGTARFHNLGAKAARQVGAGIGDEATGNSVSRNNVLHEDIEDLGGGWVGVDRDGFDPSG